MSSRAMGEPDNREKAICATASRPEWTPPMPTACWDACLVALLAMPSGTKLSSNSLAVIRARYGDQGIQEPILHDGKLVVSDDTQMTLFTLEGLLGRMMNMGASIPLRRSRKSGERIWTGW